MLSKKQVKFLKAKAHHEKSIFQMGKQGLTEEFIIQVDLALNKRELVKFNILQNSMEEVEDVTVEIAAAIGADVVQTIGHTGILYRPSQTAKYQKLSAEVNKIK